MLPKEFIKEMERLFTENFENYTITKSKGYFTITKEDSEFEAIRRDGYYEIFLETSDLHYHHEEVSVCRLGSIVDIFQDCILKDHFEDTITCFMNVLIYRQNKLRRSFREGGNKNA